MVYFFLLVSSLLSVNCLGAEEDSEEWAVFENGEWEEKEKEIKILLKEQSVVVQIRVKK